MSLSCGGRVAIGSEHTLICAGGGAPEICDVAANSRFEARLGRTGSCAPAPVMRRMPWCKFLTAVDRSRDRAQVRRACDHGTAHITTRSGPSPSATHPDETIALRTLL